MTASWIPPRPGFHLRIFAVSFGLVVVSLASFLFGVNLEAVTPATGVVVSREQIDIRAPVAGLVEPGWYADTLSRPNEEPLAVRLDRLGDGTTDPARGPSRTVRINGTGKPFHPLRPGDELWPGQVLAVVRPDGSRSELAQLEERIKLLEEKGETNALLGQIRLQRDWLRDHLPQSVLRVPDSADRWLVLAVKVAPLQAVHAGDVIATLVPLDAAGNPRDLAVYLDVEERHGGYIETGAPVRIYSTMYNHRLHGWAEARVDRLEPYGEANGNGLRHFHLWASVTQSPYPLRLGSSCKAEIVVGRKPVFRIILEH